MKTRIGSGLILALACCVHAFAQVGVWKNYTSMKEVRSLAREGATLWIATSGGLFSWVEGSNSYSTYTNAEGLKSIDLTAVAVDNDGGVWTGSTTGMIHYYSPQIGTWRYVPDISTANQIDKRINSLRTMGDTLLICSNFGLSIFHRSRFQFGDTYTKFGTFTGNVRVAVGSAVIFAGKIWASVSSGTVSRIAFADLANPNLLPPESWTLQSIGTPAATIRALAIFNGALYAATNRGLYRQEGGTWAAVDSFAGKNLLALDAGNRLLALVDSNSSIYTFSTQNLFSRYGTPLPYTPKAILVTASGNPVVGTQGGGVLAFGTSWASFAPIGPGANQFISVAVDEDGTVWGASGNQNAQGFYRFNGKNWKTFDRTTNPALPSNDCYRVSIGCNGDVWISTWGRGIIRIPKGADTVLAENVYGKNVGMQGIPNDTNFIVTGTVTCDAQGNTWIPLLLPANDRVVAVRRASGAWTTFPVFIGGVKATYLTAFSVDRSLLTDQFGNLWAVVPEAGPLGVVNLNNKGSLPDSVADYHLNGSSGLPSSVIRTIVQDREGDIWVGTDRGIAIVLDPGNPTRSGAIASYKPLSGVTINTIAVDALNQKWVGTNEGVILLSRDGTQTLAQYTLANTDGKMISNEIRSIAIDGRTGTVYFGTANGLASLTTTAVEPKVGFDELTVSPNPYRLPSAVPLTIDGLVENSKIKIITIDGRVVRELPTPGGRIGFWDGKDEQGKDVASGIYLVIAYSETVKDKVGKGKVAVIRK